jgi:hypothetical protein
MALRIAKTSRNATSQVVTADQDLQPLRGER